MDWVGLILNLVTLIVFEEAKVERVLPLLGKPFEKDIDSWRIEPSDCYGSLLREASIEFEDSETQTGLIEAVELDLAEPWRMLPDVLGEALGTLARHIPPDPTMLMPGIQHRPRPSTVVYYIDRSGKTGAVTVTGAPVEGHTGEEMKISEILVRRDQG